MNHRNSVSQSDYKMNYSKRILIIEHSESLSTLYKSILLQNDYTILTTSCGQDAINMLDSFRPNLIITPEILSDMSSADLQAHVESKSIGTYVPLLVLTTERKRLFHIQSQKAQSQNKLHLPFKIVDLRQSVEDLLDHNHADAQCYYYPSQQYSPQLSEPVVHNLI